MDKRAVGERFEEMACAYMVEQGFRILERNFRCRQGEIDVIGEDGEYLVFAEVKYRASGVSGSPAEAVTVTKQKKICRTADYYRYCHGIGEDRAVRYDVIAIDGAKGNGAGKQEDGLRIIWYKNAFFHIYSWKRGL